MNSAFSLDNSSDDSPPQGATGEVLPFVGMDAASIEGMTDETLRDYESTCFHRFEAATTKAEQHACVHEMARCIVEMSNRGLSLGAKQ